MIKAKKIKKLFLTNSPQKIDYGGCLFKNDISTIFLFLIHRI